MKKTLPYLGAEQTLKFLKVQVIESIPFVQKNFPSLRTPKEIWNYCKPKLTFQEDPPGSEFVMTVQSLFNPHINPHGFPGAGDCDDFTVLALSVLFANGFRENFACISGRNKRAPVHIYAATKFQGKFVALDLTNRTMIERGGYAYRQILPIRINS